MEVSVVIEAEVCFVVDTVEFGRAGLLRRRSRVGSVVCCFVPPDSQVSLALLADGHIGIDSVRNTHPGGDFVHKSDLFFVENAILVANVVALVATAILLDVNRVVFGV